MGVCGRDEGLGSVGVVVMSRRRIYTGDLVVCKVVGLDAGGEMKGGMRNTQTSFDGRTMRGHHTRPLTIALSDLVRWRLCSRLSNKNAAPRNHGRSKMRRRWYFILRGRASMITQLASQHRDQVEARTMENFVQVAVRISQTSGTGRFLIAVFTLK